MLYHFIKIIARLALPIFCRKVIINKPALLKIEGPILLACNHPNSFLDSVIIDTLFKQPVWSLARGDVFKKPAIVKILSALKILPVYRTSEGVENLSTNYQTFNQCIALFRKNEIITIFSEGKCINEWHLRPLKKGTARLAIKTWEENIPLKVLPVGINYSSFTRFGKNILINFGEIITKSHIDISQSDGQRNIEFNNLLQSQLKQLVFEIDKSDKQCQQQKLFIKQSVFKKILLFIPAVIGWILHSPIYIPIKNFTWKITYKTDHYDSVMTGILFFIYPLYLLFMVFVSWLVIKSWLVIFIFLLFPFTAWCYTQLKPQLDK